VARQSAILRGPWLRAAGAERVPSRHGIDATSARWGIRSSNGEPVQDLSLRGAFDSVPPSTCSAVSGSPQGPPLPMMGQGPVRMGNV